MSPRLLFRALPAWTDPERKPTGTPFRAGWSDTKELLLQEGRHLRATELIIGVVCDEREVRNDGGLRAGARIRHRGVVVNVVGSPYGDLRWACCTYTPVTYVGASQGWQVNARAVALTMQALRAVDRYGAAGHGEQYQGWKAIGAGTAMTAIPQPLTLDDAARLLAAALELDPMRVLGEPMAARACYREALRLIHPDHGGTGDGAQMARLQEAWQLIQDYHSVTTGG